MKTEAKLRYITFLWFVLTPLFWTFNLSPGRTTYFDMLSMAPHSLFHAAVFFILIFASIIKSRRVSLFEMVLVAFYYPLIVLTNFPSLTYRDVYMHSGGAASIVANGRLSYERDPLAGYWPSSFIFWALTDVLSGLDLVVANYVLYFALVLALCLIVYSFAKMVEAKGYRAGSASALLFLGLLIPSPGIDFSHFARQTYGFVLVVFFFLLISRYERREHTLMCFLVIATLATTHPQNSAYLGIVLGTCLLLGVFGVQSRSRSQLAVFSVIALVSWGLFEASPIIGAMSYYLRMTFSQEYFYPLLLALSPPEPLPFWAGLLKAYYKFALLSLLAMSVLFSLFLLAHARRKRVRLSWMVIVMMSVSLASLPFFFGLSLTPEWSIGRFSAYAAIPAAFSSLICLSEIVRMRPAMAPRLEKRALKGLVLLIIITLSFTAFTLKWERNLWIGEAEHPSELSSLEYVFHSFHHPSVIVMTFRTGAYYPYYDYASTDTILPLSPIEMAGVNQTTFLSDATDKIERSDIVLRGMRDDLDLYERSGYTIDLKNAHELFNSVDREVVVPQFNLVYSNGYYDVWSEENEH